MTEQQLEQFKKALQDEKARLEDERATLTGDSRDDSEEGLVSELSAYDPNDPADVATNLYDHQRDLTAIENVDRLLAKVNRALQKIEDGTYGLSDIDGTPIPIERLEAIPYALTTVEQEDNTTL